MGFRAGHTIICKLVQVHNRQYSSSVDPPVRVQRRAAHRSGDDAHLPGLALLDHGPREGNICRSGPREAGREVEQSPALGDGGRYAL